MSAAFIPTHRAHQGDYFAAQHPLASGYGGASYRLEPELFAFNLAPEIREQAVAYFAEMGIAWHKHRNHGLSSQACCVNYLMPLAHSVNQDQLAEFTARALGIDAPEMMPMETDAAGRDWFVAFEWIGHQDYLREAALNSKRTRGANVTSTDAAIRFRHAGKVEIALIEWKFTESYGTPTSEKGNQTRLERYSDIVFAPEGPIRDDLGLSLDDFFWEPFYQMIRQQMLAMQMEKARELDAEQVRVIHISPSMNRDLHKVTAPALRRFGDDAFTVFRELLIDPSAFVSWSIEDLFGPLVAHSDTAWADYIRSRYALFCSVAPI